MKERVNNIKKDIIEDKIENKIEWSITFDGEHGTFKCRVDQKKKVNVILQTSFVLDIIKFRGAILECADLFYSNDYPIFIIESFNFGGNPENYMIMHQILQMRTTNKAFYSFGVTDKAKKYHGNFLFGCTNLETCLTIKSFDDLSIITDYYDYNGLNITHKRTNFVDYLTVSLRKAMDNYRQQYKNSKYLKKPTDILIFTDAFSYSATSGLIKNFQNTGSGIIVGYFGNPKIKGTDLFDGSQSSATEIYSSNSDIQQKLSNLGINLIGVTAEETFDISMGYTKKNLIPREYQFDPVDERIDLYSHYSDSNYDIFIDEGLKIYNKYNKNNECNPKNERLLLHDDKCQKFEEVGLENAHGGYKCNKEGHWDKSKCFPYYCDIGYFYDRYQNKCVKECSYDKKSFLLYKKDYSNEITVPKNESYEYYINSFYDIYYAFESLVENAFNQLPRIFAVYTNNRIIINQNKNSNNNIPVKINALNDNTYYIVFYSNRKYIKFELFYNKLVLFIKFNKEHIIYMKRILSNQDNRIKIAKYDDKITFKDIQNLNEKYFKNYNEEIYHLEKDKSYAIDFNFNNIFEQIDFFLSPVETSELITITGYTTHYLYLQKNKKYRLNITDNVSRCLKLSRNSLNSEIIISGKNIKLNSDNLYYAIDYHFTGILNFEIKNDDAFVEFLYYFVLQTYDFDQLEIKFNHTYNLISIPRKYGLYNIEFEITGKNLSYSIFKGYCFSKYNYYISR